ncbi:MAG: hypothetical protein M1824_004452 [Vezdaea acicularis]|nr:MAG: hypothetical protein M1824_004452 [Vezdaea acicularis]
MSDDELEADPALLSLMGFNGFGQPSKRRKFNPRTDSVLAPNASSVGTGGNTMALGERKQKKPGDNHSREDMGVYGEGMVKEEEGMVGPGNKELTRPVGLPPRPPVPTGGKGGIAPGEALNEEDRTELPLSAYAKGVRNARGDMVYFQPSFIEDPWAAFEGSSPRTSEAKVGEVTRAAEKEIVVGNTKGMGDGTREGAMVARKEVDRLDTLKDGYENERDGEGGLNLEDVPNSKGVTGGSDKNAVETPNTGGETGMSREELARYAKGVRNERGDMVYFSPRFLEDPWAALEKDRWPDG